MNFHIEKRKAWFRTSTHTVVRDVEPEFEEFRRSEDGVTTTLVRIWLRDALPRGGPPGSCIAYIGSVQLCPTWGVSTHEIRKVLSRLTTLASARGLPEKLLRRELLECLRGKSSTGRCA